MSAWLVHIFTSLGLLAAFMAIIAIDHHQWHEGFLWLILCFFIDSVDGSLARFFRVEEVLPHMDGKTIDFVIDFVAYAVVPIFFFYKADMVEDQFMLPALGIMLLSSALYYGKRGMVEDEQYFVGFPVLWNFVVFYQFFIFENNLLLNLISLFVIAFLHFVPIRFAYPSRAKRFFWSHFIVSIIGILGAVVVLLDIDNLQMAARGATIIGGVYFIGFAIYDTIRS